MFRTEPASSLQCSLAPAQAWTRAWFHTSWAVAWHRHSTRPL